MSDPADVDVTVVLTGHAEGEGCRPTLAALAATVGDATEAGIAVEVVAVLDRADAATTAEVTDALSTAGVVGRLAPTRVVATDHGDPGAARNEGVRRARGRWVCVLDADNLPSRTWLAAAHRVALAHGGPCVVHPEVLVVFGARWQAWPQPADDDPSFTVHNFFDRTYWDTFCLAAREVFEAVPYAATAAADGLGPEDWHWGMGTVHAGFAHRQAASTALFYRDRPTGSVQSGHDEAQSLLPPSALLVDQHLAATVPDRPGHRDWRGLQREIVQSATFVDGSTTGGLRARLRRWRRTTTDADPRHYRALHAVALRLSDEDALRHLAEHGRDAGLRARLTEDELHDVQALDLGDYAALHPDLAGLDDDGLLHHYLAHGRPEGRATTRSTDERQSPEPYELAPPLVAELAAAHALDPDVPSPDPATLAALHRTGPPVDGAVTRGSRAWWRVVAEVGPDPQVLVVSASLEDLDRARTVLHGAASRTVVLVTGDDGPRPDWLAATVGWVVLPALREWRDLVADERVRLLATLVVQHRPGTVHDLGAPELARARVVHAAALRSTTRVVDHTPHA